MRRLPARDRRWRFWSPEDASIGTVPFHEANVRNNNGQESKIMPQTRASPSETRP
jgi:hypothetical protein